MAQGALRHPDLLGNDRPGIAFLSERTGSFVLR
jgi:hypothetical protein